MLLNKYQDNRKMYCVMRIIAFSFGEGGLQPSPLSMWLPCEPH